MDNSNSLQEPDHNLIFQPYCLCKAGWKGAACELCAPYWMCPNQDRRACTQPNECLCYGDIADPNKLCNNSDLIRAGMNSFPGIALPIAIPIEGQ